MSDNSQLIPMFRVLKAGASGSSPELVNDTERLVADQLPCTILGLPVLLTGVLPVRRKD
jgi:hypothetical protein